MEWADQVGNRVKLRHLRILMAVAQSGSMTKAADRLAISHPVVSKTIADLEHTLGVRLFDRTSRGIEPTLYARTLVRCGVAVFDELRQGVQQVAFLADPTVGQLRVGAGEAMAAGLVPAIAKRLLRRYPGVILYLAHADTGTLQYRELRERNVELSLGRIPIPFVEDDLVAETLFGEQMFVAVGIRSRWARRRKIELAELMHEPWVLAPLDSLPGQLADEALRASGLGVPKASIVTLSIHICSAIVATTNFVTLLPGSLLHFGAGRLAVKVLPVKFPAPPSPVGIVTVKGRTLSPLADRFVECARTITRPLARSA